MGNTRTSENGTTLFLWKTRVKKNTSLEQKADLQAGVTWSLGTHLPNDQKLGGLTEKQGGGEEQTGSLTLFYLVIYFFMKLVRISDP